jgi:hypothetical protein
MLTRWNARLVILGSLVVCSTRAFCQTEAETSALTVLRSQVQAIAEVWSSKLSGPESTTIGLRVAGTSAREFTENSILEVLQRRGYGVTLNPESGGSVLDVLVHEQSVSYEALNETQWKRIARVSMEARLHGGSNLVVRYLGKIDVSGEDTVTRREDGWWSSREEEPGTFEKILIPIAVITTSALVVYLFFTVRN